MTERTTTWSYSDYLKSKQSINKVENKNYDYNKAYNKALSLSNGSAIEKTEAVKLLKSLVAIRKDPDVLTLLQTLRMSNPDC